MRIPRISIKLSTLMLLIAAIALGMAIEQTKQRHNLCMRRIREFRSLRDGEERMVKTCDERIALLDEAERAGKRVFRSLHTGWDSPSGLRELRFNYQTRADHYESRRGYYARAAYLPFLSLPDGDGYLPNDLLPPSVTPPPAPSVYAVRP